MLYLVDRRIKKLVERIVDIDQYDYTGVYYLEWLKFSDESVYFVEDCFELSINNLLSFLRVQRTKLLMKFYCLLTARKTNSDSIF